jgi:hypothetical protein
MKGGGKMGDWILFHTPFITVLSGDLAGGVLPPLTNMRGEGFYFLYIKLTVPGCIINYTESGL